MKSIQNPTPSLALALCLCGMALSRQAAAQTPTPLETGQNYNLTQAPQSTAAYAIALEGPAEVTIHISNWISTYDWGNDIDRLYVYNSEQKPVARNQFSSPDDPYLFHMFSSGQNLVFRVGTGGTYTIALHSGAVKPSDWGTATSQNYSLMISALYCKDVQEPNDTMQTATPLPLETTITAYQWRAVSTAEIGGDEDWYAVTLPGPGKLGLELSNWVGVYDWSSNFDRLYVYNAEGASIGMRSGYDFYDWMMGDGTPTKPHVTEMNLTQGGVYYLRYHAGAGVSTAPYQLKASLVPANDPFEPNDDFANAKKIPTASTWYQAYEWKSVGQNMNVSGDEDFYYFVASGAGTYSIALQGWLGIYNWGADYDRMTVYDSNQRVVGNDPLAWMMGETPISFQAPSAGKYYVHLHCGQGVSLDGYKIKLTGSLAPDAPKVSVALHAAVTIDGNVGATYVLEYSTALAPDNWLPLTSVTLEAPSQRVYDPSPINSAEKRFYRARLVQ